MNKKSIIGVIIAAAVIIGVVSMISYGNILSNIPISPANTTQTSTNTTNHINTTQPIKTPGKHLSVELNENMGVKASP
jgi:hypothetical protein